MSLVLHVDGDRWRAHLRQLAVERPGLVPVAKGNGYGFGNHRLARRAGWLGVDTLAIGTYDELDDVADRYHGDLLVLTPWRPFLPAAVAAADDERVLHTVGRLDDLVALDAGPGRPRVVLERATSMRRHGFSARELREAATLAARGGVHTVGVAMHLPLAGHSHLAEMEELLTDVLAAGLSGPAADTVWVSHLSAEEVGQLATRHPDLRFRPRIGTDLWLGARDALRVTATVLDSHRVRRGDVYGYRGRSTPRSGTILIVSGGTAHGIGLEAPTGAATLRSRASSIARGGMDAAGLVRSPYTVAGKQRLFAEPPHMQASMLFVPHGTSVPALGDEIECRVRFTTTDFDRVDIS